MGIHEAAVVAGACSPISVESTADVYQGVACIGETPFPATSVCSGALPSVFDNAVEPQRALKDGIVGSQVVTHEAAVGEIGNLTPAAEVHGTFTTEHMKRMKDNAIDGTTGHLDCEIGMEGRRRIPGIGLEY